MNQPRSYPPVLLDTSIPMYAASTSHPYKAACQWVMTEIANRRIIGEVAIDVEVILHNSSQAFYILA